MAQEWRLLYWWDLWLAKFLIHFIGNSILFPTEMSWSFSWTSTEMYVWFYFLNLFYSNALFISFYTKKILIIVLECILKLCKMTQTMYTHVTKWIKNFLKLEKKKINYVTPVLQLFKIYFSYKPFPYKF
jgi:hypothetical protein